MPTVSLYVKNEDYVKWLEINNKSEWFHDHINGLVGEGFDITTINDPNERVEVSNDELEQIKHGTPVKDIIDTREPEEESDYYTDLVIDKATGYVFNKVTMEQETDITPEVVKELKRRGQVE